MWCVIPWVGIYIELAYCWPGMTVSLLALPQLEHSLVPLAQVHVQVAPSSPRLVHLLLNLVLRLIQVDVLILFLCLSGVICSIECPIYILLY